MLISCGLNKSIYHSVKASNNLHSISTTWLQLRSSARSTACRKPGRAAFRAPRGRFPISCKRKCRLSQLRVSAVHNAFTHLLDAGTLQQAEALSMPGINMSHRLITLATCNLDQWAMDFEGNLRRVKESIQIAKDRGATYRVSDLHPICMQILCCCCHCIACLGTSHKVLHTWLCSLATITCLGRSNTNQYHCSGPAAVNAGLHVLHLAARHA